MKIVSFPRLAALVLCAVICAGRAASASPWAEVGDNQLRSDIELLAAVGVIEDVTTHWPLPWRSLERDLRGNRISRQPLAVQQAAERVLRHAQAETAPGLSVSLYADATNRPNPIYGFDGMGRGDGQIQASVEAQSGIFSGRVALGALTQTVQGKSFKLMPEGTYFSARLGGVRVYGGYLDHWWGPGQISALSLSNNARPMPQVGIERSSTAASSWPVLRWLGPWQFEFLLGYLDGPRLQTDTYYNAGRLTVHPLRGLDIGVSRTEEFCGQRHSCVPVRDYLHFANNPLSTNNTNDQATFDVKYSHTLGGVPFQAYIQLMNEDYSWFNHSGTSHLFGASAFLPTRGNPVKLTVEYTNSIATHHPFSFDDPIHGFAYNNATYPDGMRYRGRSLGFSLDSDSTLLSLQGSWTDPTGRFYELSLHHANISNAKIASVYGPSFNVVTAAPVIVNMAEARVSFPWRGFKFDVAGRLQDDQPRPQRGFEAALEVALRVPL